MAVLAARWATIVSPSMFTPEYLAFDNKAEILSIACTFSALAYLCILARLWVKVRMLGKVGADDYTILFSTASSGDAFQVMTRQMNTS